MAVRVKREPGSPGTSLDHSAAQHRICYVCGGPGAAYPLNCRLRDRAGSYFPFLEQHEVPQGAKRPTSDGVVLSCMLCFSFLNQQWEAYERNHTPHSKRLYWLKRADNGHYIGAEMRLQGEYAAQIIGVSPEPGLTGGPHGHCTQLGGSSSVPAVRPMSGGGRHSATVQPPPPPPPTHHHHHHHHHHHRHRNVSTPQMTEEYRPARDRCDSRSNSAFPPEHDESYDSNSMLLDLRSAGAAASPSSANGRISRSRDDDLAARKKPEDVTFAPANGALDLSMPDKNAATEACYLCGEEVARGTLVSVFAKQIANCPFFPSLMLHPRPSHSRPMDPSGCVQACAPCYQHLLQQWDVFQRQNVPHSERRYQLWKRAASVRSSSRSSTPASPQPPAPPSHFGCFLCSQEFPWNLRHILYSGPNAEGEPPLPFLERFKPSRGALPLSAAGQALACSECYKAIHRQRHAYMDALRSAGILEDPASQPFPLPPPPPRSRGAQSGKVPDGCEQRVVTPSSEMLLACHVCHLHVPRRHLKFSDVLLTKNAGHGFFPAAVQDDGDGFPICTLCYGSLLAQWDAFEEEHVPYHQRRYVLPTAPFAVEDRKFSPILRPTSRDDFGAMAAGTDMVLRIRVPSPEQDAQPGSHGGAPLLTTVSTTSDSPVSTISVGRHSSVRSAPPLSAVYSNALDLSSGSSNPTTGRPAQQPCTSSSPTATTAASGGGARLSKSVSLPSGKSFVCYICRLCCTGNQTYAVRSYPPKSPATPSGDPDANPSFFPFLTLHPAPPDSEPVADDGTVLTCTFCYHSLLVQWAAYEASRHPPEHNPWARTYNCHDYVCFVCGVTTYRKRVKAISVADFPFLMDHVRHPGSLVLDGGDGVTVCLMCYETLSAQWNDFERMKVPLELRKYNWITAPPPPEDEEPPPTVTGQILLNGEDVSAHPQAAAVNDESDANATCPTRRDSRRDSTAGLAHSSKQQQPPPPLTASNLPSGSASQKAVIRTSATAIVPPLSQVSPGGGTGGSGNSRTASFAAALRKLAEQATEPLSSDKDQSPATSPCPTPTSSKRTHGPPSLVLAANSHSSSSGSAHSHHVNSSFSSPPVSTVPATQAHHGYMDGQKQGLERPLVVQPRDAAKGLYEESRKSGHSNHHSHGGGDVSRENGVVNSSAVRSGSSSSYAERRDVDASPSKASSLQAFLPGHSSGEAPSVKVPGGAPGSGYYGDRGREEHPFAVNGLTAASHQLQHLRSQHHMSAAPRLEDPHLAASSSFQPYRTAPEETRHPLPQHVPSSYDTASPYGYHPTAAFLPPQLSHPSFRLDDQMYFERYALLRSPLFPLPHPGVLPPHHVMPFMPGARYPAELLAHPLSLVSPTGHHLLAQERLKLEEQQQQRRERELELYQEQERRRERDRERERDKEREQRDNANEVLVLREQDKGHKSQWSSAHSQRSESPVRAAGVGSITQGTPRDLVTRSLSSTPRQAPTTSSSPPNLAASVSDPFLLKSSLGLAAQSWGTHCFPHPPSAATDHLNPGEGRDFGHDAVHSKAYPSIPYSRGVSPVSEHERSVVLDGQQTCESTMEVGTMSRSPFPPNSKMHHLTSAVSKRNYSPSDSPGFDRFHRVHPESMPSHNAFSSSREPSHRTVLAVPPDDETERKPSHHSHRHHSESMVTNHHLADHETRLVPKSEHRSRGGSSRFKEAVVVVGEIVDLNDNNVPWCARFRSSGSPVDRSETSDGRAAAANRCPVLPLVKSKLDLAAERARLRNRSIEEDWSDDDEFADERRWSHLLTITCGPPLPLNASKEKVTFLAQIGLTTQKRRRDIEFDSYLRRSRRLRELGVGPVQHASASEPAVVPWFLSVGNVSTRYSSDELCREPNFKEKVQFLQQLNLCSVPRNKRDEVEQILRAVVDEKIRRNGHVPVHYRSNHCFRRDANHPPNHLNAEFKDLVNKGAKRKAEECPAATTTSNGDQPPFKRVTSLLASSRRKTPSSSSARNHSLLRGDLSGSSLVLPLVMGPTNKDTTAMSCAPDDGGGLVPAAVVISYGNSNEDAPRSASARPLYGRDFAQEFHESVLLQTQQQKSKDSASARIGEVKHEKNSMKDCDLSLVGPESRRRDAGMVSPAAHSHEKHHKSHSLPRWPGIECLMEAYERHQQEQKLEKEVLLDQCSRLKVQNQDLNNVAEKLSQTVADLIHMKKDLDEERQLHHQAIDGLKCILKQMR